GADEGATSPLAYHGSPLIPPFCGLSGPSVDAHVRVVQHRHEGQVAVALAIVKPIADDEAVGYLEADIAGRQLHLAPLWLGQQRAHLQRARIARAEVANQ